MANPQRARAFFSVITSVMNVLSIARPVGVSVTEIVQPSSSPSHSFTIVYRSFHSAQSRVSGCGSGTRFSIDSVPIRGIFSISNSPARTVCKPIKIRLSVNRISQSPADRQAIHRFSLFFRSNNFLIAVCTSRTRRALQHTPQTHIFRLRTVNFFHLI